MKWKFIKSTSTSVRTLIASSIEYTRSGELFFIVYHHVLLSSMRKKNCWPWKIVALNNSYKNEIISIMFQMCFQSTKRILGIICNNIASNYQQTIYLESYFHWNENHSTWSQKHPSGKKVQQIAQTFRRTEPAQKKCPVTSQFVITKRSINTSVYKRAHRREARKRFA